MAGAVDDGKCPCGKTVDSYGPCSSEIVGTIRGGDWPTDPDYYNVCSNHAKYYTGAGWKTWQEYSKPAPPAGVAPSPADVTYNGGKCPYHGKCNSTDISAYIRSDDNKENEMVNICREHAKHYISYKTFGTYPEGGK